MIFNSLTYLLFLVLVTTLYWLLNQRSRQVLLFTSSLVFYGFWRVEFLPLMLVSTVTDYVISLRLSVVREQKTRWRLLLLSLFINLALLFYFKYLFFFSSNISSLLGIWGVDINVDIFKVVLPLGISFYTFQTISYTIDVYRRQIEPERDFIVYAAYVTFFPQLVAGPILRAKEVVGQLKNRPKFNLDDFTYGLKRILSGLFLKTVFADNIAGLVDSGFSQPVYLLSAIDVWTLAFMFGLQIYFDFSAYSHIAIGSARLMGIRFPENFNFPYSATSPRDFWKRWHISLSSWIRDYLYLPLVGAKVQDRSTGGLSNVVDMDSGRKNLALLGTWAIMGLWHGANWTFVAWGLWHALLILAYRVVSNILPKKESFLLKIGGWAITLPLVMLGWISFRANNLSDVVVMYSKVVNPAMYLSLGMKENNYLITALLMFAVIITQIVKERTVAWTNRSRAWLLLETPGLALMIALVFIYLRPINQFIYFQF